MTNNLYCFVGKSGSGKDTIVDKLCRDCGYSKLVSYTTRKQRNNRKDKNSHIFVTLDDYSKAKAEGKVMTETYFDGNYYWSTNDQIDESDFYIIDLVGLRALKKEYKNRPIVSIYVDVDNDVRIDRMKKRGDDQNKIKERFDNDTIMFSDINEEDFDLFVPNNGEYSIRELCYSIQACIQEKEKNV